MIHQIYCTHCTYGTSVLEQREGELADRVLGYSARAASPLDRNELRGYYRQIERFLSYYLPSDTPPEEKPRLDAESAPRRFFVCPSMGNLQAVGQVSYRSTDTAGRVGSYFAHVLFTPREQGGAANAAWSTLDALRLWQAPWADCDSLDLPFNLPALEQVGDLWAGGRPAIDDDLVLRFLQSPAGQRFDDPASVVPPRWQAMAAHERVDLLCSTLQGLLALGLPRRASVLLVTEPSVAALVFYAVARLLPAALLEGVSFSTYEPTTERLPVTLAATTFFTPETSDVRPDLYRRGGLVLNSYTGRISENGPPSGRYARFIVERLLTDGWSNVDRLLESFGQAGAKRPEDLEVLAQTHPLVSHVLSAEPLDDGSWRGSNVAANYLRQEVRHQLAHSEPGWPELQRVAGSPNHLQVLELMASDTVPADLHGPTHFLLNKLPPERFPELLASPRVASSAKLEALQYYVTRQGRLPDGCEMLWADETNSTIRPSGDRRPLIERLFARLPEAVLVPLCDSVPEPQQKALFLALLRACRAESRSQAALKRLLLQHLNDLSDTPFVDTIVEHREALRACCAPPEPILAERLVRLLYELPSQPRQFQKWLAALELWVAYFPEPDLAERSLADWRTIRQTLEALRDEAKPTAAGRVEWLKSKLKPAAPRDLRALAEALGRAMRRRSEELDDLDQAIQRSIITPEQVQKRLLIIARTAGVALPSGISSVAPAGGSAIAAQNADRSDQTYLVDQQAQMYGMLRAFEQRSLVYSDDEHGSRRQTALRNLGMEIVRRPDFLPAEFWTQLRLYFEYGDWREGGGVRRGNRAKRSRSAAGKGTRREKKFTKHMLVGIGAALAILALGLGVQMARQARRAAAPPAATAAQPDSVDRTVAQASAQQRTGNTKPPPPSESRGTTAANDRPSASQSPPRQSNEKARPAIAAAQAAAGKNNTPQATDANAAVKGDSSATNGERPPDKPASDSKTAEPPAADTPASGNEAPADPTDEPSDQASPSVTAEGPSESVPTITGNARAYEPALIWTWDTVPKKPKLTLRGLDFVNRHLDAVGKVVATDAEGGLDIALIRADEAAPLPLAVLKTTDKGLAFHWADPGTPAHPARECQDYLRRCVVKVESDEPSLYVALSKPSQLDPLGLSNAAGKLDLHALKPAAFPPLDDDELRLGPGRLVLDDGRSLVFGSGATDGPPYMIDELPRDFQLDAAQVSWDRDDRGPLWRVRIGMPDDPKLSEENALLQKDRRLLFRIDQLLKAVKRPSQSAMRNFKPKPRADFNGRIAELSELIHHPAAATLPAQVDENAMTVFQQQLDQLIEAARLAKEKLSKRISNDTRSLDAQQRLRDKRMVVLRPHLSSLSAVVYRKVDNDVQAPYVILGDPMPPPPPSERRRRERGEEDE